jgi:release factor glutamine methyltransferase
VTIAHTLTEATQKLRTAGFEQPAYEARELLAACCAWTSAEIIANDERELSAEQSVKFLAWLEQRLKGVPLAYLSKTRGFFKHDFAVEPGVLVPRPETELVVEVALRRAASCSLSIKKMADFGAGTGCIGLSILYEFQQTKLWAVESSPKAAALIVKNAEALGIYDRTQVDCVTVELWEPEGKFDLIVANPPYIPVNDPKVQKSVHDFEPHAALYSGTDGLDAIRSWIPRAFARLNPGGLCVFENGLGQAEAVRWMMNEAGFHDVQMNRDGARVERVVSGFR